PCHRVRRVSSSPFPQRRVKTPSSPRPNLDKPQAGKREEPVWHRVAAKLGDTFRRALAMSGWAKIGRRVAATICRPTWPPWGGTAPELYGQPLLRQFRYEDRVYPGLTVPQGVRNSLACAQLGRRAPWDTPRPCPTPVCTSWFASCSRS